MLTSTLMKCSAWVLPRVQCNLVRSNWLSPRREFIRTFGSRDIGIRRSSSESTKENENPPKRRNKSKKFKVVKKIEQHHIDKLHQAFDELARKDGFDTSDAYFADDESFEDDFDDVDFGDFVDGEVDTTHMAERSSAKIPNEPSSFDLSDVSDDVIDHSPTDLGLKNDDDDDMDARIAAAMSDDSMGLISVPTELDSYASRLSSDDLKAKGYREFDENDPANQRVYELITNAMTCPACGVDFQCTSETKPGYLPPEKFDFQVKLGKIEEMQRLKDKAGADEWSTEDEVEWLIQTGGQPGAEGPKEDIDVDALAEELGIDLSRLTKSKVICKRCHGLQNFGKVDENLRPGWTKEPMMSQENFLQLLRPLREKTAVIIALVDLFDFAGSVLPELDEIAGENPVILAANKADLLPSQMGAVRAENWVRRELEYLGVQSLANVGGAVRLISCKTGAGVEAMLAKARQLAESMDCDIYVVGAANAGKSTLLNQILRDRSTEKPKVKRRAGNANARKGAVTASPLPGTTLRFIKVDLGDGLSLYDTPGLLVPGTMTQLLTPEELKMVVPKKRVEPITFRVASGKCVLIGGLARIELVGDCKPFLFTVFVSNDIKIHPTSADKADSYVQKHAGNELTPPLEPGEERLNEMGKFEDIIVDIEGTGWKEAAADIALTGLGWVAVTGAGSATVKISVPNGIGVSVRPPLMPFDIWESTARYTGTKAVRRVKQGKGKKRKGVGRR